MRDLTDQQTTKLVEALSGVVESIRATHQIPKEPFQVGTDLRIELKLVEPVTVVGCGTCRSMKRGQGEVGYCGDPRCYRSGQVVRPETKPCNYYERNGTADEQR